MKTIKLTNKTDYFTRDLEKLFTLVLREYKRTTFDLKYTTLNVACVYRKRNDGTCNGYAWYNTNNIIVKLPKNYNKKKLTPFQKERNAYKDSIAEYVGVEIKPDGDTFEQHITRTFLHLIDICRGRTNGNIIDAQLRNISYLPDDLIVRVKQPPVKKKKTDDTKLNVLNDRMKKWESKLKRCETAIKKIAKQIKYYEKKKSLQE
jgi:hypothetical protein